MMSAFKLLSRPHNIICLDDDVAFVELLALALPQQWQLTLFTQTAPTTECLTQHTLIAQHDFALFRKALEDSHNNGHIVLNILQYWKQNPQRWGQAEVLIMDYAMPKMNGLKLLETLPSWHGLNILLTGVADEVIAVKAFNDGLIQQFIPKQSDQIIDRVVTAVDQLNQQRFKNYQVVCETGLTPDQLMLLHQGQVQEFLTQFAGTHWIEYVVLGNPFGVLGLADNGQLSWLQIERACDIEDLKAIAHTEAWDAVSLMQIESGSLLSNSLLRQSLSAKIASALAPVTPIGDSGLIAAHFLFEAPVEYRASSTYNDWLAANNDRVIRY